MKEVTWAELAHDRSNLVRMVEDLVGRTVEYTVQEAVCRSGMWMVESLQTRSYGWTQQRSQSSNILQSNHTDRASIVGFKLERFSASRSSRFQAPDACQ